MLLYFAYGSNMSRALMRKHCPQTQPIGNAVLDSHRFIVTTDGYASIAPSSADQVHGVLWRLAACDVAALNAYEGVDAGLYRLGVRPVRHAAGMARALVYMGRTCRPGRPRPGYLELVLAAAEDWKLPPAYMDALGRWAPGLDELRARPSLAG